MPSAVSGLTNHEAPSAAVVPAGRGWQSVAFRSRYCAYIAPPIIDTVLPSSACAASDELTLITVPAPSLPTGIAWSRRAAMKASACSGTLAVILIAAPLPEALAVLMSAGPSSRPRSDGLIGVASTLTKTWSGPGSGIGTSASDSSSSPLFLIRERSCNPFVVPLMFTSPLYPFMRPLLASTSGSRGKCLCNRTELLRCRRLRPSANSGPEQAQQALSSELPTRSAEPRSELIRIKSSTHSPRPRFSTCVASKRWPIISQMFTPASGLVLAHTPRRTGAPWRSSAPSPGEQADLH